MARGVIAIDQIQVIALQGNGTQLATTDSTYTAGNVPVYDSTGKLVDSGASAGSGGTVFTVNGAATVTVNGAAVSYDNITTVNGA